MKRASYRRAVEFVALNDEAGSGDSPDVIRGYASVGLPVGEDEGGAS